MFGLTMRIEMDELGITLRALSKNDLPQVVNGFTSMKVHRWTTQMYAQTLENEEEWYENNRKAQDSCVWGIVPDGSEVPVGVTGLHRIDIHGSCTSGIIIWDTSWWRKGVATRAHLARTLYAADYLNRLTIKSMVRCKNPASLNALKRVGYSVCGVEPRTFFRDGEWVDSHHLIWLNPQRISLIYPEGLPKEYEEGVVKATESLEKARQFVQFV